MKRKKNNADIAKLGKDFDQMYGTGKAYKVAIVANEVNRFAGVNIVAKR